jgi:hypothetical protein
MYKIIDKKIFNDVPEKEQEIFIEEGAKQQQEMFSAEESHKGLTWKDYISETRQHYKDKYDGKDGKESFIYKINETDYIERLDHNIDRTFWKEGDYIDWETDFMTKDQLQSYADGL